MGNSKSKAAEKKAEAELNKIYSMNEKDQTEKIVEIIKKYLPTTEKLTKDEIENLNTTINQLNIPHGNYISKQQYTTFYSYIALSLIQGEKLDEILTKLVNLDGVCFQTVIEKILSELFDIKYTYQNQYTYVSGYKNELKNFILKELEKQAQVYILYTLLKLALLFQEQIKGADAKYNQYCYESSRSLQD